MGKKFDSIYEAVVSRYNVGGYLPGDIVKFRPSYKNTPTYKAMHSNMQKELDELVNSGLNIKVVQVGSKTYNHSSALDHKTADNVVITVAGDHGGGRHYGSIAVSPEMIDIEDASNPTPKIPDQFYRKDDTNWKPEEWKSDQQNITRVSDKGNGKNTPTNLKLAGESKSWRTTKELGMIYENLVTPPTTNPSQTQGTLPATTPPQPQPQTSWPPADAKIFVKPNGFGNARLSPSVKPGYYAVLSDGSVVIPPEERQDPQIYANYGEEAMTTGNIGSYEDAFNDVRVNNQALFSQIANAINPQQTAQIQPQQTIAGESTRIKRDNTNMVNLYEKITHQ